jgi:hypothetical protein
MMMATDSTPRGPRLNAASIDALESALQRYLTDANEVATLQAALRPVAAEAREKKMHAEQLLVLLKDLWFALPQVQASDTEQQHRTLQRVVTLCIREYYST